MQLCIRLDKVNAIGIGIGMEYQTNDVSDPLFRRCLVITPVGSSVELAQKNRARRLHDIREAWWLWQLGHHPSRSLSTSLTVSRTIAEVSVLPRRRMSRRAT